MHPLLVAVPVESQDGGPSSPDKSADGSIGTVDAWDIREEKAFHLQCDFEEIATPPVRGRVALEGLKQCVAVELVAGIFGVMASSVSPGGVEVSGKRDSEATGRAGGGGDPPPPPRSRSTRAHLCCCFAAGPHGR